MEQTCNADGDGGGAGASGRGGEFAGRIFCCSQGLAAAVSAIFFGAGAGYMLAVAFLEIIPESIALTGKNALLYVLAGFFLVHLFEHTLAPHSILAKKRTRRRCRIIARRAA